MIASLSIEKYQILFEYGRQHFCLASEKSTLCLQISKQPLAALLRSMAIRFKQTMTIYAFSISRQPSLARIGGIPLHM
jgi:hypothetical protein